MDSFTDKVIERVTTELETFKNNMLLKSPIEIYNEASRIQFYEYMSDYIQCEDLDENDSEIICKNSKKILRELWDTLVELDDFNIGSSDDAFFLLRHYIDDLKTMSLQM